MASVPQVEETDEKTRNVQTPWFYGFNDLEEKRRDASIHLYNALRQEMAERVLLKTDRKRVTLRSIASRLPKEYSVEVLLEMEFHTWINNTGFIALIGPESMNPVDRKLQYIDIEATQEQLYPPFNPTLGSAINVQRAQEAADFVRRCRAHQVSEDELHRVYFEDLSLLEQIALIRLSEGTTTSYHQWLEAKEFALDVKVKLFDKAAENERLPPNDRESKQLERRIWDERIRVFPLLMRRRRNQKERDLPVNCIPQNLYDKRLVRYDKNPNITLTCPRDHLPTDYEAFNPRLVNNAIRETSYSFGGNWNSRPVDRLEQLLRSETLSHNPRRELNYYGAEVTPQNASGFGAPSVRPNHNAITPGARNYTAYEDIFPNADDEVDEEMIRRVQDAIRFEEGLPTSSARHNRPTFGEGTFGASRSNTAFGQDSLAFSRNNRAFGQDSLDASRNNTVFGEVLPSFAFSGYAPEVSLASSRPSTSNVEQSFEIPTVSMLSETITDRSPFSSSSQFLSSNSSRETITRSQIDYEPQVTSSSSSRNAMNRTQFSPTSQRNTMNHTQFSPTSQINATGPTDNSRHFNHESFVPRALSAVSESELDATEDDPSSLENEDEDDSGETTSDRDQIVLFLSDMTANALSEYYPCPVNLNEIRNLLVDLGDNVWPALLEEPIFQQYFVPVAPEHIKIRNIRECADAFGSAALQLALQRDALADKFTTLLASSQTHSIEYRFISNLQWCCRSEFERLPQCYPEKFKRVAPETLQLIERLS